MEVNELWTSAKEEALLVDTAVLPNKQTEEPTATMFLPSAVVSEEQSRPTSALTSLGRLQKGHTRADRPCVDRTCLRSRISSLCRG